jgi:hypothetical protein
MIIVWPGATGSCVFFGPQCFWKSLRVMSAGTPESLRSNYGDFALVNRAARRVAISSRRSGLLETFRRITRYSRMVMAFVEDGFSFISRQISTDQD